MIRLIQLLIVVIIVSCKSPNQRVTPMYTKVFPESGVMNSAMIKPHKVSYKKMGGEMIYDLEKIMWDSTAVYKLSVYFNVGDDGVPDVMYFDTHTLGYLGRELVMSDYTINVRFKGNQFTGDLTPAEGSDYKPIKYNKSYEHGAFEPAVINYFIAALPLKEGYTASLPLLDLNNGSEILWANIEVEKKEVINIDGKSMETWKVLSHGIREKTIWVSTTEPYFVRMKTEGNWGTWELDKIL